MRGRGERDEPRWAAWAAWRLPRARSAMASHHDLIVGLKNLGNTCFLNATLQCIFTEKRLVEMLLERRHSVRCGQLATLGWCFLCVLERHVIGMYSSSGRPFSPTEIARSIPKLCPEMRFGRQEDAHELVLGIIDKMQQASDKV